MDLRTDVVAQKELGALAVTDDKKSKHDEEELVLDWDDAVDDWGQGDLASSARAVAAPFPAKVDSDSPAPPNPTLPPELSPTDPAPAPTPSRAPGRSTTTFRADADSHHPRPLYRPPSAAEVEALREQLAAAHVSDESDDGGDDTRIAAIPRELIESLARLDTTDRSVPAPDTDPNALLARDGSGVFGPASVRPALKTTPPPPALDATPFPEYARQHIDKDEDDDDEDESTRVLDLNEVDFGEIPLDAEVVEEIPRATQPPPVPETERQSLKAPPVPASLRPAATTEVSVLRNLDELSPPVPAPEPLANIPSAPPAREDRGAKAALRTVRSRKPRTERLPLVGMDESALRARVELLMALAQRKSAAERASLLVQAAELCEQLDDRQRARELYGQAITHAPTSQEAFRGLSRVVLASGDSKARMELLEKRASTTIGPRERARLLTELALTHWLCEGDRPNALRAATEAQRLVPDDVGAAALLLRLNLVANPAQADGPAAELARRVSDVELEAALLGAAGRASLARGDAGKAAELFKAALVHRPDAFDAHIGAARALHTLGQTGAAADHVLEASAHTDGVVSHALRRQAARLMAVEPSRTAQAASLLADTRDGPTLRLASSLAMRTDDVELQRSLVDAWTQAAQGKDRALSLITLAELRSAANDGDGCEEALQAATRAEPELLLVPVVREVLARRRGDTTRLAEVAGSDDEGALGPLAAAAQLASDPGALEQELVWLERARAMGAEPSCVDVVTTDAAAAALAIEPLRASLHSRRERATGEQRLGLSLALADVEQRLGDVSSVRGVLTDAAADDGASTLLSRALARHAEDAQTRATAFRREAETTRGARAAFALLRTANAGADSPEIRLKTLIAAHDAAPSYAPATSALHQEARRQGDLDVLSDLHGREAGRAADTLDTVGHLVRAALIKAGEDADGAAAQLARALDLVPSDPVLRELVLRLGDAVPATLRAEAMQRAADQAPEPLRRAALLSAAGAFEDARQPERAGELYRAVAESHAHDPIAEMGLERVAKACGQVDTLLARLRTEAESGASRAARVSALEELLSLDEGAPEADLQQRAQALFALDPRNPLALRKLERTAMADNDTKALLKAEIRMLEASSGPRDKAARLRAIAFARDTLGADAPDEARLDVLLLAHARGASTSPWLSRQLLGAALLENDAEAVARAEQLMLEGSSEPIEVTSAAILLARSRRGSEGASGLAELEEALSTFPDHPIAAEALAELLLQAGDARGAAERFEAAAKTAQSRRRTARLWYRAGVLWQEELKAPDRARDAMRQAAEADLTYGDVQQRLEMLLSGRNDVAGLIALTETRLKEGGAPEQLLEVHRTLSKLHDKKGDRAAARQSLKNALALSPDHLQSLRDLADLCERDRDWRECAEALIRLARLSREPAELREAFFKLGEIYDLHLPDARRAEAAYRRVLKLGPKHAKALERLAALYRREGQSELAIEALERLVQVAEPAARRREVAFELARLKEEGGDPRGAEETLEGLRRMGPTDLYVLRALADFYRRQDSAPALAMHLNRAAGDLRAAIHTELDDAGLWTALVEVLDQRGRRDAASTCASAAYALGLADASVVSHLDHEGGVPGVGGAAFSELLDDLLYPESMNPAVRVAFRHAAEALNKTAPFDVRALGAEKLDRKHPLRAVAQEMARWSGASEVEVLVTSQLPFAFVPIQDSPVVLLLGKTLLDALSPAESRFLVARALKMARAQMSLSCRIRPDELALMLHALIRAHAPDYNPENVDLALLEEMARRIARNISKKGREDLMPHLVELEGAGDFEPLRVYEMASTAANRAGLLATGSTPAAANALCKLAGMVSITRTNTMSIAQVAEARDLVMFSISEAHFEARQRAGVDR